MKSNELWKLVDALSAAQTLLELNADDYGKMPKHALHRAADELSRYGLHYAEINDSDAGRITVVARQSYSGSAGIADSVPRAAVQDMLKGKWAAMGVDAGELDKVIDDINGRRLANLQAVRDAYAETQEAAKNVELALVQLPALTSDLADDDKAYIERETERMAKDKAALYDKLARLREQAIDWGRKLDNAGVIITGDLTAFLRELTI